MKTKFSCLIFLLGFFNQYAQHITGTIVDDATKHPIEGASIYFDNTTIGTISNSEGSFKINYNDSIKAPLVISFLGYKKQIISDYSVDTKLTITLVEDVSMLNEIVITRQDSWSRESKLRVFRKNFIGYSDIAKSCLIKNEDDIWLEFYEESLELRGRSKQPLIIENKKLKYLITYDLQEFIVKYKKYIDTFNGKPVRHFRVESVKYVGTSYYEDISDNNKKINKRREDIYSGSVLHFMRALYRNKIEENGFKLYYQGRLTPPINFISIYRTSVKNVREVRIFKPLIIVYNDDLENKSNLIPKTQTFELDVFGNFSPVEALIFYGKMGKMRIAETLPLDY